MTTVYLNRTDEDFWWLTFRQVVALIDQWREIEKGRDMMRSYIANGGDPGMVVDKKTADKKALEMGNALW